MINIKDISKYALQISFRNETRFVNNAHIVLHLNRDSRFNFFRKTQYLNMIHWSMTLIDVTKTIFEHLFTIL